MIIENCDKTEHIGWDLRIKQYPNKKQKNTHLKKNKNKKQKTPTSVGQLKSVWGSVQPGGHQWIAASWLEPNIAICSKEFNICHLLLPKEATQEHKMFLALALKEKTGNHSNA